MFSLNSMLCNVEITIRYGGQCKYKSAKCKWQLIPRTIIVTIRICICEYHITVTALNCTCMIPEPTVIVATCLSIEYIKYIVMMNLSFETLFVYIFGIGVLISRHVKALTHISNDIFGSAIFYFID